MWSTRQREARVTLVRMLQAAHAGELAAANAYRGHWHALRDPDERAEVRRIEESELSHRQLVRGFLESLGARPQPWREATMDRVGRFFGYMCRFFGWFLPMYVAGLLEAMNVRQYVAAVAIAEQAGCPELVEPLTAMVREEARHEVWFGDRCAGHRLLPVTSAMLGWRPPLRQDDEVVAVHDLMRDTVGEIRGPSAGDRRQHV